MRLLDAIEQDKRNWFTKINFAFE